VRERELQQQVVGRVGNVGYDDGLLVDAALRKRSGKALSFG
jgi:hypothetical protein